MRDAMLSVFRDSPLGGAANMGRDEALLYCESARPAALRIYGWSPATISLGCFQRFEDVAELPADVRELPVVRRPTGGGAILHDREITYALIIDDSIHVARQSPVALYQLVHGCWQDVLVKSGWDCTAAPDSWPMPSPRSGPFFCFEKAGKTDLLLGDRKLLGSAQRRIPGRVLQHGSLLLGNRVRAHPGADLGEPREEVVEGIIGGFIQRLSESLGCTAMPREWTADLLADAEVRAARFAGDEWTRRR